MNIGENEIESWVNFPRYIINYLSTGKISRKEFFLYTWLRVTCDMYGKTYKTLGEMNFHVFNNSITDGAVYKYLLSLKNKRLLYYMVRRGSRGAYEIELDYFLKKNKEYTDIGRYYSQRSGRDEPISIEDVSAGKDSEIQRLLDIRNRVVKEKSMDYQLSNFGGTNNDK
jgi:hypothetical protein